jgi:hypothetical protein
MRPGKRTKNKTVYERIVEEMNRVVGGGVSGIDSAE